MPCGQSRAARGLSFKQLCAETYCTIPSMETATFPHEWFFALPGEPVAAPFGTVNESLQLVLNTFQILSPSDGRLTSNSLQISIHTMQAMIGIPLEAFMARFGCDSYRTFMALSCIDRTIRVSAAFYWFFCPATAPDNVTGPGSDATASMSSALLTRSAV